MKTEKELIDYLINAYKSGCGASGVGICYTLVGEAPEASKTFSIEIKGIQYSLHGNKLADSSVVGDVFADEIKNWASK